MVNTSVHSSEAAAVQLSEQVGFTDINVRTGYTGASPMPDAAFLMPAAKK
jgi:hypothetical protein